MAGRYDNPIPTRFLAPVDWCKIPALFTSYCIIKPPVFVDKYQRCFTVTGHGKSSAWWDQAPRWRGKWFPSCCALAPSSSPSATAAAFPTDSSSLPHFRYCRAPWPTRPGVRILGYVSTYSALWTTASHMEAFKLIYKSQSLCKVRCRTV